LGNLNRWGSKLRPTTLSFFHPILQAISLYILYMICPLACLMAMCRLICSYWRVTMIPTRLLYKTYLLAYLMALCRVIFRHRGFTIFPSRLLFKTCTLACLMAMYRVTRSS